MLMLRGGIHDAVGGDGHLQSTGQAVVGTGSISRGGALCPPIVGEGVWRVCSGWVGW